MASDGGFGPADGVVDEVTIEGGEGDAAPPKAAAQFERSPLKVLQSLESNPLEQAVKCIEYLRSVDRRKATYLKACSPKALDLIAQNGPEFLGVIQAVA